MPVVAFSRKRHIHPDTKRGDEIVVLIAIEDKTMNNPHLLGPRIEIEPYNKRQPLTSVFVTMCAFDAHTGPDVTTILHLGIGDFADVVPLIDHFGLFRGNLRDGCTDQT